MRPDSTTNAGVRAAFRSFYREHYRFVWHVLGRFGVAPAERGDAAQDTFVTAYRKLAIVPEDAAQSWLYGIARRVASNYRRGARRAQRKRAAILDVGWPSIAPATAEAVHVLDRFLTGLDEDDRELFVLSEILGLSGPEIVAATALEQRVVYARARLLRKRIAEIAPDGLFAALCRVRADPPRASSRGWVAIVAALPKTGASVLVPFVGIVAVIGTAVGISIAVASPEPTVASIDRVASRFVAAVPTSPSEPARPRVDAPVPVVDPPAAVEVAPLRPTKPRAVAPTADDTTLAQDNALLRAALTALAAGDAEGALAHAQSHAERFPASPQADVRDALRVDALCRLGRSAQGRGERRTFLERHPDSPMVERVRRACPDA